MKLGLILSHSSGRLGRDTNLLYVKDNTRKLPDRENRENSPLCHWARGAGPLGLMVLWCFSLQVDRRNDGKGEESPCEVTSVSSFSEPLIGVLIGVLTSLPATKSSAFWSQVPQEEPAVKWILGPVCMRSVVGHDDSSRNGEWSSPWIPSSMSSSSPSDHPCTSALLASSLVCLRLCHRM